jgi:hypothetical protein
VIAYHIEIEDREIIDLSTETIMTLGEDEHIGKLVKALGDELVSGLDRLPLSCG